MVKNKIKMDNAEKSGVINMIIKPIGVILSLIYTPLLLNYLGTEKYGLWATVLSIISWVNYFDVGIGNGLRNSLSIYLEKKDYKKAKKVVSTAYVSLTLISIVLLVILTFAAFLLNWNKIFSTTIDMRLTLLISFVFICINFVLALGNILLYALQLSEQVSIRNVLVQILNIFGMVTISKYSNQNLVLVSILFGLTQLIVNIGNTIQVMHNRTYLIPEINYVDKKYLYSICTVGLKFFIIQLMCLAMFTVDDVLITHFWGAEVNASFSIVNKVYNTGYSFFAAFMVPFWSGTTAAFARKDKGWIYKSLQKSVLVLCVFIMGYILMIFVFKPIVRIWLGKDLIYQTGLIPVMAIFYTLYSILNIESQFINGTGDINIQMFMYIVLGVLNIPFSIFLGVFCKMQAVGIRMATLLLVAVADVILGLNLKYILKRSFDF